MLQIVGDPLKIRITDEYLEVVPSIGGNQVSTIDTTETLPVDITFIPKK